MVALDEGYKARIQRNTDKEKNGNSLMDNEAMHLERILEILDGQKDPKGNAVLHYLGKQK